MPRTLLIVDDMASNRLILKEMLRREYHIMEAGGGEEALELIGRHHAVISAVLLDISMPGVDGFEVLRRIRSNAVLTSLPVIMITGSEDKETRVRSLTLGANDFVMKPYSTEIIKHCLQNNIAFAEAAVTVNALQRDRLTGVYNRDTFFEKASSMIEAKPNGYYILACVDVDHFKMINDQYGSDKGDGVLKSLANGLQTSCDQNGGICGRIYSDCFVALYVRELAESGLIGPSILEERLYRETGLRPTLSIGRYLVEDKTLSVNAMYDRAAIAKDTVKGRYDAHIAVYNEGMRSHLLYEQGIVNDMNAALAKKQFEVWFQPQYNHVTDAMVGAEALVRWRHPEKGLIPPDMFIPIFEQNGFIYSLDRYVWEETCRCLHRWREQGRNPLPVSVNISRYDALRPDLVEVIEALVRQYQLPKSLLRLEITESAFAKSSGAIVEVVKTLIDHGFTVEIDDFGSGYSSLNTLKDVPAQIIKLDMKFLESDSNSERGGNIIESVVRMAKWLGISVIAEGVETLQQANFLRSIGCYYMQGYLYAKPMPAEKYEVYCRGTEKEERLIKLETVENLNNNAFWDPKSMDTLIFNSYVGGACIYEYHNGKIEVLRATEKYAQLISGGMTVADALKLDMLKYLTPESRERVLKALEESLQTGKEVAGEYVFIGLPGCPRETYLRSTMRVIAVAGERQLVYCTNENITAQRLAERHERETAEKMQTVMDNMISGVSAVVIDGEKVKYLFTNDRYYEIHGYTRAQFNSEIQNVFDLFHPEDRQRVLEESQRANVIGKTSVLEYRVIRRDGQVVWVKTTIVTRRFEGVAQPVQVSVVADVTEQHAAEQQIHRLSQQMQAIMDNVDLGIIAVAVENGAAKYLFSNNHYYEMLGYTKAQFERELGSPYKTIAAEDLERVMAETARINHVGASTMLTYTAVTRDKRRRSFKAVISIARLSGVDTPVQFSIIRDVTEEQEAERRERIAAEQNQVMMRDMPGGFVRLRQCGDGRLIPVCYNDGMVTLTGMSREALTATYGVNALNGVHPEDLPQVDQLLAKMAADSEAHSARYRLRHKDGYIWLSVIGRKTVDASGDTFYNIYYTDFSEQIKAEAAQRALLDNLPGGAGLYEYQNGALAVVHLNKSYWGLVGRVPADYAEARPAAALHPDDWVVAQRELDSAIEQKRDMVCDIRLKHETEGYRPVHLVGHIVPEGKERYAIYATFTPISDETVSYQQILPLLLSAMMESTADLSFSKDTEFRYLSASRPFVNMVGRASEADVVGKTDYDLFDKAMADKFRRDDETLLKSGRALTDRVELIPSENGAPRYSSTSKYVLRDGFGKIIGLYGIGRDITKVVTQDSQLRLVNDSIPGGLAAYVCTPGGFSPEHIKLSYFNDGFCKMFGFTREEYQRRAAQNPMSMILEEDRGIIERQWSALMENGTPINCLYRARLNGGGYKWISHKAVATDRQNDKVVINAILQDVTDQRELIEQLRISEEENNLAVQLGGNIVMRYLVAEKTLSLTPCVAAAHDLPETLMDVPHEPVRRGMIAPESADAFIGFFEAIQNGSKAGSVIYRQRYLGEWRWMEAKSTTIFSDDGKPAKAVISLLDVTDRLEKETVYKKWQQSLEDRPSGSYTLFRCNLNNDWAYAAAEGALIAFDFDHAGDSFNERRKAYTGQWVYPEDQDKYTAFMNADTMLASYYRGKRSDALEYRELLPGGGLRWLRVTVDLVEHPSSTDVEAYLMYENIDEAKRAELETKELSETDPLTGILNRATFAAKVDAILRASKPETRHALLMMDIDGFKQVNDVFGHGAGDQALVDIAGRLRVMTRRDDLVARLGGDEFVMFLGDVLNEEAVVAKAKQVCAAFRKAFSLEVQISGSVGVALAPRDGMTFKTLYKKADAALYYVKGSGKDNQAVYRDDMADEHLEPEPDRPDNNGALPEKKRRMLIVDDSSIDHALLQNIFKDEFLIEKAKDGGSALIRLRHYGHAISVVLLDLRMPGMDGFAVLRKMQESAELRTVPVIIVSGDESRETCLKAIREGATDFITKPVDAELLRIRVHSAVSKAENERLRAQNSLLEVQNEERMRFESAIESTGVTFIEYNWLTGEFLYHPSISRCLMGTYDDRGLWRILLSDGVADTQTVRDVQQLVQRVAEVRGESGGSQVATLKTPEKTPHRFRVSVRKRVNEYQLTDRIMITLNDLDYQTR